jgi:hypothetical protein
MDHLTLLSNKYKCDKSDKNHLYTPFYNSLFENDRDKYFNMLEFGYGKGRSIKMWLDYFYNANILSIDIGKEINDKELLKNKRFKYLSSNQIDKDKIFPILKEYKEFHLIIDDASHVPEDQQYTFGYSFPFVSKSGYYIIEDLECKRNHNPLLPECISTLNFLEKIKNEKIISSPVLTIEETGYISNNIDNIMIYGRIAFIKKRGEHAN